MTDQLDNETEYSLDEIQHWLNTRSRICTTSLWKTIVQGKDGFEVGDYTYFLTPLGGNNFRVTRFITANIISEADEIKRHIPNTRSLLLTPAVLGIVFLAYIYFF